MGDTIMFRGTRRFLVLADSRSVTLEKLRANHYKSLVTHYGITPAERATIRIVALATDNDRARARQLYEASCLSHTRIEWSDDNWPTYVHTVAGVEHRYERRR